jgi:hypothetical protein
MKKLKLKYSKSPNYNTNFVSGAQGGIAPNGLLNIHFFIEKNSIPSGYDVEIDEKGKVIKETNDKPTFEREILTGIVLDINTAKAINTWLTDRISELEQFQNTLQSIKNED